MKNNKDTFANNQKKEDTQDKSFLSNQTKRLKRKELLKITLLNIEFIIQSFKENDFINLSITNAENSKVNHRMSGITIYFHDNSCECRRFENDFWREFISKLNIKKVITEVTSIVTKSK